MTYNKKQKTNEKKSITVRQTEDIVPRKKQEKIITYENNYSKKKNLFVVVSFPSVYLEKVERQ